MLIRGEDLRPDQRDEVLRVYIYRWTKDSPHRSRAYRLCPHCGVQGGEPSEKNVRCRQVHPTIPFQTDEEWIKSHAFDFVADGSRCFRQVVPISLIA